MKHARHIYIVQKTYIGHTPVPTGHRTAIWPTNTKQRKLEGVMREQCFPNIATSAKKNNLSDENVVATSKGTVLTLQGDVMSG